MLQILGASRQLINDVSVICLVCIVCFRTCTAFYSHIPVASHDTSPSTQILVVVLRHFGRLSLWRICNAPYFNDIFRPSQLVWNFHLAPSCRWPLHFVALLRFYSCPFYPCSLGVLSFFTLPFCNYHLLPFAIQSSFSFSIFWSCSITLLESPTHVQLAVLPQCLQEWVCYWFIRSAFLLLQQNVAGWVLFFRRLEASQFEEFSYSDSFCSWFMQLCHGQHQAFRVWC